MNLNETNLQLSCLKLSLDASPFSRLQRRMTPAYQDDGVFPAPNYVSPSCTQNYETRLIGEAITSE